MAGEITVLEKFLIEVGIWFVGVFLYSRYEEGDCDFLFVTPAELWVEGFHSIP